MIFIAGKPCKNESEFSSRFQLISGMVSGAAQWLEWAVPDETFCLSVDSEEELLTRIQEGLHGSGLMCLDWLDLLVHPLRLVQMDEQSLTVLAREQQEIHSEASSRILADNGLITCRELSRVGQFLEDLGVGGKAVFQGMGLSDQIRILRLCSEDARENMDSMEKEAPLFAIRSAQSPCEFADRYEFFVAAMGKIKSKISRAAKIDKVNQAWDNLLPLCNRLLETFSLNRSGNDDELLQAIRTSLLNGLNPGFPSRTSAMRNIMVQTTFFNEKGSDGDAIVNNHIGWVQEIIRQGDLEKTLISQDGMNRSFVYSEPAKTRKNVTVCVDIFGVVTIAS